LPCVGLMVLSAAHVVADRAGKAPVGCISAAIVHTSIPSRQARFFHGSKKPITSWFKATWWFTTLKRGYPLIQKIICSDSGTKKEPCVYIRQDSFLFHSISVRREPTQALQAIV
jgi:hypothetical protein